jgi:hypothetical protein
MDQGDLKGGLVNAGWGAALAYRGLVSSEGIRAFRLKSRLLRRRGHCRPRRSVLDGYFAARLIKSVQAHQLFW